MTSNQTSRFDERGDEIMPRVLAGLLFLGLGYLYVRRILAQDFDWAFWLLSVLFVWSAVGWYLDRRHYKKWKQRLDSAAPEERERMLDEVSDMYGM